VQTVCRCDRGAYSAKFDEAMKFLGERKRDLDEADPERDRSANSRGRNENIFNAIQEEDDESRYGDGFPAARPRLQADEQQVRASRPEPRLQRAQSNSKSQSSRRDRPSPDQLRHPADPAASRRHRPEAGQPDQSPAEAATGREDPLPPIRDRLPASGKSKATSSKSRRRRTLDPNGFEKWFKKHKHSHMYPELTQQRAGPRRSPGDLGSAAQKARSAERGVPGQVAQALHDAWPGETPAGSGRADEAHRSLPGEARERHGLLPPQVTRASLALPCLRRSPATSASWTGLLINLNFAVLIAVAPYRRARLVPYRTTGLGSTGRTSRAD